MQPEGLNQQEKKQAKRSDRRSQDAPEHQPKADQDRRMNDVDGERVRRQEPPDRSGARRESSEYHQNYHTEPSTECGREDSCRDGRDTRVRRHHPRRDRKSTRLNSSHVAISYAVFCLKKKKHTPSHHTAKQRR